MAESESGTGSACASAHDLNWVGPGVRESWPEASRRVPNGHAPRVVYHTVYCELYCEEYYGVACCGDSGSGKPCGSGGQRGGCSVMARKQLAAAAAAACGLWLEVARGGHVPLLGDARGQHVLAAEEPAVVAVAVVVVGDHCHWTTRPSSCASDTARRRRYVSVRGAGAGLSAGRSGRTFRSGSWVASLLCWRAERVVREQVGGGVHG